MADIRNPSLGYEVVILPKTGTPVPADLSMRTLKTSDLDCAACWLLKTQTADLPSIAGELVAVARPLPRAISRPTQRDKLRVQKPYSITSSARTRIVSGMVIPRTFAVLVFTTSSNLAGRSMGRSAGLLPPKIRPT
jgi:hypothetical protein